MYYSPPKSSIWGHSLRKVRPETQRARLEHFLADEVAECRFSSGGLYDYAGPNAVVRPEVLSDHFAKLLDTAFPTANLKEDQFERCYRELLTRPELFDPGRSGACLTSCREIAAWRIDGSKVATGSTLILNWGARPWITPRFSFKTLEVFEYLREALQRAELGKLNPRHVKGEKP